MATMIILAALAMTAAGYAQLHVPRYTATRQGILLTRAVLLVMGIAFGYVSAQTYAGDRSLALLAFLIGFGAVHVPAAIILLIKHARGSGKT
jgi:hypothetical protein